LSSLNVQQFDDIREEILQSNFEHALNLLDDFGKNEKLSVDERLYCDVLRVRIQHEKGNYQEALVIAEEVLKQSEKLESSFLQIDAYYERALAYLLSGGNREGENLRLQVYFDKLLSLKNIKKNDLTKRKALYSLLRSMYFIYSGEIVKGKKTTKQALTFANESGDDFTISQVLCQLAFIERDHGDLDLAPDYALKAIEIAKARNYRNLLCYANVGYASILNYKKQYNKSHKLLIETEKLQKEIGSTQWLVGVYQFLTSIFQNKREYDKVIEYYKKSIEISKLGRYYAYRDIAHIHKMRNELEEACEYFTKAINESLRIGERRALPNIYYNLIETLIELGKIDEAKKNLDLLEKMSLEYSTPNIILSYRFAQVEMLEASTKLQDWMKAVEIIKELLQDKDLPNYWRVIGLYRLTKFRLKELQLTNDKNLLKDIQKNLTELLSFAKKKQYHGFFVNLLRLQSQLELIHFNPKKAIELLNESLTICEKWEYEFLKTKLLEDKEKLNKQLGLWDRLKSQDASLAETLKHVSLEKTINEIAKDTVLEERDSATGEVIESRKLFSLKF